MSELQMIENFTRGAFRDYITDNKTFDCFSTKNDPYNSDNIIYQYFGLRDYAHNNMPDRTLDKHFRECFKKYLANISLYLDRFLVDINWGHLSVMKNFYVSYNRVDTVNTDFLAKFVDEIFTEKINNEEFYFMITHYDCNWMMMATNDLENLPRKLKPGNQRKNLYALCKNNSYEETNRIRNLFGIRSIREETYLKYNLGGQNAKY